MASEQSTPYRWDQGLAPDSPKAKRVRAMQLERREEINSRMHRLFVQNAEGAGLLAEWVQHLLLAMPTNMNPGLYELGHRDGQAHLVRVILKAIEESENG